MNKKISILHITPFFSPNVGGVETHLDDLIKFTKNEGFRNFVLTYQAVVGKVRGQAQEISDSVEIHRLPMLSGVYTKSTSIPILNFLLLTPLLLFYTIFFLLKKSRQIDLINAHGINAAIIGMIAKKLFNKPLVVTLYVEFNFKKGSTQTEVYLFALKMADKVLVMTERSKEELIRLGMNSAKIIVYSHWVDQELFKPLSKTDCRKKLNIQPDQFVALFVGRLMKEKGIYLLADIAKKLPNILFLIIAAGDLAKVIGESASKIDNISFVGKVDYQRLPLYYTASDVLIVPSLVNPIKPTFTEGIPRVIMEALSCGTPIIGTDNGGIKEIITEGKVGYVVDSNVESFTTALEKLSHNPAELKKLQSLCKEYSAKRFNYNQANIITNTYKELTQNG